MKDVCVVLPAYNEDSGLLELVLRICQELRDGGLTYEIVVVDDGSTDETSQRAAEAARAEPVSVKVHEQNRGYGRAIETGLRDAQPRAKAVVTMDSDCSHDPSLIVHMLRELERGHDVVIASRFTLGGQEVGVPIHRRLLSRVASHVARAVLPIDGVRDYTSGYRAYRSSLLGSMLSEAGSAPLVEEHGFTAGLELLLKANARGATVSEVPLVLRYDRKQSASSMRIGVTTLRFLRLSAVQSLHRLSGPSA